MHRPDDNAKDLKDALRREYKSRRAAIPSEIKKALDTEISKNAVALASFRFADTVLVYAPTGSEIDLTPIVSRALECGKKVAFPVCNTENKTMTFKLVRSLSELVAGAYSIPEPAADAEELTDFARSICIVPGLVFDREGFRVGYGKGYYDRFLSQYRETKIGLVYSDFILDCVPRGRFDQCVDILVCEKGVKIAAKTPKNKSY